MLGSFIVFHLLPAVFANGGFAVFSCSLFVLFLLLFFLHAIQLSKYCEPTTSFESLVINTE